jgi:large repetitive protein
VQLRDAGDGDPGRRPLRRAAAKLGVVAAGLLVVAGTTTVFDASSFVLGSSPPTETLSCTDTWTGSGLSGDWDAATNWTTGVPNSTSADVCLSGGANVVLSDASFSIGELTVSAGSTLTIGNGNGDTKAGLSVSSGLQNDGSLTVNPSGTSGQPVLILDGPITNTGTLTVNGTVGLGTTTSGALTNDGTIGVAPGGLINMNGSSTLANEPDGLLAFGIDGPPSSVAASGRITNGALSLAGSADPVFEDGYTPSAGAEYFVDTGTSTGAFASVLHGARVDYAHPGEVGLTGGAAGTTTSTSVTSSVAAGSTFGQSVRLTATVVPASGSNPTGSVSFTADGMVLGSSAVTTGAKGVTSAALDVSDMPVGSDSVTATYGGDVVFGPSTSSALTQVVNPDPTNVTITASSASPVPDQPVIDTATVSRVTPRTGTPAGTISFTDDGSPVTGCQSLSLPSVAPLQVSCTETYASSATHVIVASYSGDEDDVASNASLVQAVGQVPTQTTVASSSPTSSYGQNVTLTATVTPMVTASGIPTGTVTFYDFQTNPIATVGVSAVAGSAIASADVSSLMAGFHSITATYNGDATFGSSTSSAPVSFNVAETQTIVTVASSADSTIVGQPVVFTVTISSWAAGETGTVQFVDDGSLIGSGTVSGGQASFETGSLTPGTHPITAVYEGDDNFVGSSSVNTVMQTVNAAPTSTGVTNTRDPGLVPTQTTVMSSSPASTYGQSVTLTARVIPSATASADPGGTVTFYDYQTNPIGTVSVSTVAGATTASLDIGTLMGGLHSITATYNGDQTFATSSSDPSLSLDVAEASTIVKVASSADATVVGQPVVFNVTINSSASGETGTVQFVDNGLMIGSGIVSDGQATFQTGSLTLGAHPITAVYEGDDDFVGSSSTNAVTQTVGQASSSTDVSSSHDQVLVGQAVAYTATVAVTGPGSGSPTGSVSFSDGGIPIPTCQGLVLPPGPPQSVTCSQVYDTSTGHSITATYGGDANFTTSTGTLAQNVSPVSTTTSVVPSPPAATSGQSVTLTATVAPTTGTALPDGTVTFSVNGTALGSSTLSTTDGVTTTSMLLTTLPLGSDSVVASYGGSADFLASSSASAATVTVTRASTTLGLLASANPLTPGQPVTLTATVFPTTGSGETGVVTFYDNGVRLGTSRVSNGQATLNVFTLPAGDDPVTADYTGDDNFIGSSTTTPLSQMVGQT